MARRRGLIGRISNLQGDIERNATARQVLDYNAAKENRADVHGNLHDASGRFAGRSGLAQDKVYAVALRAQVNKDDFRIFREALGLIGSSITGWSKLGARGLSNLKVVASNSIKEVYKSSKQILGLEMDAIDFSNRMGLTLPQGRLWSRTFKEMNISSFDQLAEVYRNPIKTRQMAAVALENAINLKEQNNPIMQEGKKDIENFQLSTKALAVRLKGIEEQIMLSNTKVLPALTKAMNEFRPKVDSNSLIQTIKNIGSEANRVTKPIREQVSKSIDEKYGEGASDKAKLVGMGLTGSLLLSTLPTAQFTHGLTRNLGRSVGGLTGLGIRAVGMGGYLLPGVGQLLKLSALYQASKSSMDFISSRYLLPKEGFDTLKKDLEGLKNKFGEAAEGFKSFGSQAIDYLEKNFFPDFIETVKNTDWKEVSKSIYQKTFDIESKLLEKPVDNLMDSMYAYLARVGIKPGDMKDLNEMLKFVAILYTEENIAQPLRDISEKFETGLKKQMLEYLGREVKKPEFESMKELVDQVIKKYMHEHLAVPLEELGEQVKESTKQGIFGALEYLYNNMFKENFLIKGPAEKIGETAFKIHKAMRGDWKTQRADKIASEKVDAHLRKEGLDPNKISEAYRARVYFEEFNLAKKQIEEEEKKAKNEFLRRNGKPDSVDIKFTREFTGDKTRLYTATKESKRGLPQADDGATDLDLLLEPLWEGAPKTKKEQDIYDSLYAGKALGWFGTRDEFYSPKTMEQQKIFNEKYVGVGPEGSPLNFEITGGDKLGKPLSIKNEGPRYIKSEEGQSNIQVKIGDISINQNSNSKEEIITSVLEAVEENLRPQLEKALSKKDNNMNLDEYSQINSYMSSPNIMSMVGSAGR